MKDQFLFNLLSLKINSFQINVSKNQIFIISKIQIVTVVKSVNADYTRQNWFMPRLDSLAYNLLELIYKCFYVMKIMFG